MLYCDLKHVGEETRDSKVSRRSEDPRAAWGLVGWMLEVSGLKVCVPGYIPQDLEVLALNLMCCQLQKTQTFIELGNRVELPVPEALLCLTFKHKALLC